MLELAFFFTKEFILRPKELPVRLAIVPVPMNDHAEWGRKPTGSFQWGKLEKLPIDWPKVLKFSQSAVGFHWHASGLASSITRLC